MIGIFYMGAAVAFLGLGIMVDYLESSRARTCGFVLFVVGTISATLVKKYSNISMPFTFGLAAVCFSLGTLYTFRKEKFLQPSLLATLGLGILLILYSVASDFSI